MVTWMRMYCMPYIHRHKTLANISLRTMLQFAESKRPSTDVSFHGMFELVESERYTTQASI